ncbi:MAG: hypothetical protein GY696_13975 [Gammaproteobacteria bacterium]|nr:hypothetical protein [Gammaproteobacteria bacterium]
MTEPIELKFPLNNPRHPGFKVGDGEVYPSRSCPAVPRKISENPIFAYLHRCSTGESIFRVH